MTQRREGAGRVPGMAGTAARPGVDGLRARRRPRAPGPGGARGGARYRGPRALAWSPDRRRTPVPSDHASARPEEHTSELQSLAYLVCRLLLEKKKNNDNGTQHPNPSKTLRVT